MAKVQKRERSSREEAMWHIERSRYPIPVKLATKAPTISGWQDLRIDDERKVAEYFSEERENIGLLLGIDGLTDIDLDCPEAIAAGEELLPETPCVFGRKSTPRAHRIFWLTRGIRTEQLKDPVDKQMVLELRCLAADGQVGLYTLVPPSLHPSGERIRYERRGKPARIGPKALCGAVRQTGAAALLARHFPAEKSGRNETFLALAGTLAHAGFPEEIAVRIHRAIYSALWDQPDHVQAEREVRATYKKLLDGKLVTGYWKLINRVPEEIVRQMLWWLRLPDQAGTEERQPLSGLTDAGTLYKKIFEPVSFLVPGILPKDRLVILAGRPKSHKTWIALEIAVALALGREFLGQPIKLRARVLFLEFDDVESQIQERLNVLFPKASAQVQQVMGRVNLGYKLPLLQEGGVEQLGAWLEDANRQGDPFQLVVLDPYLGVRSARRSRDLVAADYQEMAMLRKVCAEYKCAVLLVHHLRKAPSLYGMDEIVGTSGIAAGVDVLWIIKDDPQDSGYYILEAKGRLVREQHLKIGFLLEGPGQRGVYRVEEGPEVTAGPKGGQVLRLLKNGAKSPKEIAEALGVPPNRIHQILPRLLRRRLVNKEGGKYVYPS